jgi:hypothetical protein
MLVMVAASVNLSLSGLLITCERSTLTYCPSSLKTEIVFLFDLRVNWILALTLKYLGRVYAGCHNLYDDFVGCRCLFHIKGYCKGTLIHKHFIRRAGLEIYEFGLSYALKHVLSIQINISSEAPMYFDPSDDIKCTIVDIFQRF